MNTPRPLEFLAAALTLGVCASALADPVMLPPGRHTLPITGLVVELPKVEGLSYQASSSWNLDLEKSAYDGRDVIDEKRAGELVAGNWIHVGYFSAGTCDKVVTEADLSGSWTAAVEMWGGRFTVRGGIWDFEDELGTTPTVVACAEFGKDRPQLLMYRFLIDQPDTLSKDAALAAFKAAVVPAQAWQAYRDERYGVTEPTHRPEVRNRGAIAPTYLHAFKNSAIKVQMPDDGFVWLPRESDDGSSDMFDRMAPSFPDVTIEFLLFEGQGCAETFESLSLPKRAVAPTNLPEGWIAGPQLDVDGDLELTLCLRVTRGALVAGVFQGPTRTDIAALRPLLDAVAKAAR